MSSNIGICSQHAVDRAMYLASVVERAIIVCSLDAQVTGQPAYVMAHPERDLEVVGSIPMIFAIKSPCKVSVNPTFIAFIVCWIAYDTFISCGF